MNVTAFRILILIAGWVALSACGFRLAGTVGLPESLDSIHLITSDFSKTQRDALSARLARAGAVVINQADADAVQLSVTFKFISDRRLVASASNGKTVDRLARSLDFSVKSATGEVLMETKTLVQQKDIVLDDDNLLASTREKETVIEALEQALFNQLLQQLKRI